MSKIKRNIIKVLTGESVESNIELLETLSAKADVKGFSIKGLLRNKEQVSVILYDNSDNTIFLASTNFNNYRLTMSVQKVQDYYDFLLNNPDDDNVVIYQKNLSNRFILQSACCKFVISENEFEYNISFSSDNKDTFHPGFKLIDDTLYNAVIRSNVNRDKDRFVENEFILNTVTVTTEDFINIVAELGTLPKQIEYSYFENSKFVRLSSLRYTDKFRVGSI